MSNLNSNSQVLLALAARKIEVPPEIDDLKLSQYLAGELPKADRQEVLVALANHPTLLAEVIDMQDAIESSETTVVPVVEESLFHKLMAFVTNKVTISGLVVASISYFLVLPMLTQPSIQDGLYNSYAMINLDEDARHSLTEQTKSFEFNLSALKRDVNLGQAIAKLTIVNAGDTALNELIATKRSCENTEACEYQENAIQLGQWLQLNTLQCESTLSATAEYWQVQYDTYASLQKKMKLDAATFSKIENSNKEAVCLSVSSIGKARF